MKYSVALVAGALLAFVGVASAVDLPIPGKVVVVKPNKLVKIISKDHGLALPVPASADDPTVSGATLTFKDLGLAGGTINFTLDASGWSTTSSGYKYKGKDDALDPNPKGTCRVVLLTRIIHKS